MNTLSLIALVVALAAFIAGAFLAHRARDVATALMCWGLALLAAAPLLAALPLR